jgi:hypothetical protein
LSIEKIRYMGLPDCLKLSNGTVDVIVTTAVGPRILFYGPTGGDNVFALHLEAAKETALGIWKPYGGHRLWVWPEVFPATYAPDNSPVHHTTEGDFSLELHQPEDDAGIEKRMRLTLSAQGSRLQLEQTICSRNLWPIDIAAWGISVVQPGTSILPRVPFQSHDDYAPVTQPLALCAFTDLQDPRFTLGLKYILLQGDPTKPNSQKIGLRNKENWCAHLTHNLLFVKCFEHQNRAVYPDYGVNTEAYTEGAFQELELMGPRRVVNTGESLVLNEEWHLFEDVDVPNPKDLDALDAAVAPRVQSIVRPR